MIMEEPRPLYIEGYTDQLSYQAGEEIAFHISTSSQKYSLEIARLGAAREVVWSQKDLPGAGYPIPRSSPPELPIGHTDCGAKILLLSASLGMCSIGCRDKM